MADIPILFSDPMVKAKRAGRKTQTRRLPTRLKSFGKITEFGRSDTPGYDWRFRDKAKRWHDLRHDELLKVLPWQVGDRLWVREAWRCHGWATDVATIMYRASEGDGHSAMTEQFPIAGKDRLHVTMTWRPSIHLPRWASRTTCTVTDVRVQRLQEISEADCIAEGIQSIAVIGGNAWRDYGGGDGFNALDPGCPARRSYRSLWDHINGAGAWDANPWIVALAFIVQQRNIDAPARAA